MQSVPITTNIVSSNHTTPRCNWYNIMLYSLSVNCDRSVVFSMCYGFLHLPPHPLQVCFTSLNWVLVMHGSKARQHSKFPINRIEQIMKDMTWLVSKAFSLDFPQEMVTCSSYYYFNLWGNPLLFKICNLNGCKNLCWSQL
jgi:hypothetical protein